MHTSVNTSTPLHLRLFGLLLSTSLLVSCVASIKPIYNDKEQAKAQKAVDRFHQLRNGGRAEEIYALLDDSTIANLSREQFIAAEKQALEEWGKVETATLSEAKVFPSTPIQVKMIYNVKFERKEGQEWFIWNINGDEARLFGYEIKPGFDVPDSKK